MKVGEQIRIAGDVKDEAGVLQDLSTWTITAKARRDNSNGSVLGDLTITEPGLGLYVGVIETVGFPPGFVAIDVRFEPPVGSALYTRTMYVELEKAITA